MRPQRFRRSFDSLEGIFRLTEEFFSREEIDREHLFPVQLAIEELFTNMVKYNPGSSAEVALALTREGDELTVVMTDPDTDPFDVTEVREPEVDLPLEERQPGGLGLLLARRAMDRIEYEHTGRESKITLIKKLG